ncbi:protein kinase domain-containing protein [Sorangium sp. So ce854]|uniref:serine/threonine-protein kinase n=1 Tax=Sorangium sp. So ce854 TaxID=3133322 RepID=UPI003F5EAED0
MPDRASEDAGEARVLGGRYRLRAPLGRGGHGEVWDADDLALGERVAIKWLLRSGPEPARVRSEIATLRMLRLPGVVRLLDEGMEGGRPFFVMERVAGAPFPGPPTDATAATAATFDLDDPLAAATVSLEHAAPVARARSAPGVAPPRAPRRSWAAIVEPTEALVDILARVHAAGIVHRDLKPENVLVRADGRPVVLDFGLALGRVERAGAAPDGRVVGTPAYLAPEQVRGDAVDARADLYALGVMLYEALTGALPHEASSVRALLLLRAMHAPAPVRERAPEVPEHVAALVDRLLAPWPDDRPRSAAEVRVALRGRAEPRRAGPALLRAAGPLTEEALRDLFAGPDRLFHLREDGARALWSRSGGEPARVAEELDTWVRAGIARWDGDRLVIERDTLDHLGASLQAALGPDGSIDHLGASPQAALGPDGSIEPGRLLHLIAAGDHAAVAETALALARDLAQQGRLGQAVAVLHEGVLSVRHAPPAAAAPAEARLLAAWVAVAFAERRPQALDRVLYELCRAVARASPDIARLEALVRAGLVVDGPSWQTRARAEADALHPFADPDLERWRQWVRVRAGLRASPEAAEAAVAEAAAWAERTGHPVARASVAGWLGLLRYEQGRFDESARWHAEAAAGEAWLPLRMASTLNEATSLLEAFRPEDARRRARAAGEMAARCRHPYFEARAAWVQRTAAFRMGQAGAPDRELVDASVALGAPDHLAAVCCTEAAVAYIAGDLPVARELVDRALEVWRRLDRRWLVIFARCFMAAIRGASLEDAEPLAALVAGCPVTGLGIQALGLLRRGCPSLPPFADDVLAPLCGAIPEHRWDERLDVLSVRESLAAARGDGLAR